MLTGFFARDFLWVRESFIGNSNCLTVEGLSKSVGFIEIYYETLSLKLIESFEMQCVTHYVFEKYNKLLFNKIANIFYWERVTLKRTVLA